MRVAILAALASIAVVTCATTGPAEATLQVWLNNTSSNYDDDLVYDDVTDLLWVRKLGWFTDMNFQTLETFIGGFSLVNGGTIYDNWHMATRDQAATLWAYDPATRRDAFWRVKNGDNLYWQGRIDYTTGGHSGQHQYCGWDYAGYSYHDYPVSTNLYMSDSTAPLVTGAWVVTPRTPPVPEPATSSLLGVGILGSALWGWRKRSRRA